MNTSMLTQFGTRNERLQKAFADLRAGHGVLLLDDEDRENEADIIYSAERIDEKGMALLIRECSGIVCLCLPEETLKRLQLPQMVEQNSSQYGTGFTVSIEAAEGVTTGVSAKDRLTTIRAAIAIDANPQDLARPGHVFPLRARKGGVLTRKGHTEGTVDLVELAGLQPSGVLCELMNEDGTMARGEEVVSFAKQHDMTLLSIQDIVEYRLEREEPLRLAV